MEVKKKSSRLAILLFFYHCEGGLFLLVSLYGFEAWIGIVFLESNCLDGYFYPYTDFACVLGYRELELIWADGNFYPYTNFACVLG